METAKQSRSEEVAIELQIAGDRRRIAINTNPFTIGRSDTCDATISDWRISRLHAQIVLEDGGYFLVDAGSKHGTFLNGARVERQKLKNGDAITLSAPGVKITFQVGVQASRPSDVLLSRMISNVDASELEKLRLFLEAARNLGSSSVVNDVLRNMLDCSLRLTGADKGFVYLRDRGKAVLACGLDRKGHQLMDDSSVSHSVVNEALTSAAEFITNDASQQSALAARQSVLMNELRTVIAIPLRGRRMSAEAREGTEAEGVLYLDSRAVSLSLSGVSQDVLRALANECAGVLESAKLVEAERAALQYSKEMEIAASIQRSLICEPEVTCDFARVTGRTVSSKEVGGDFFDAHVSPDAVTVIVADVSGKGISAALLASVIHGMFYAQISTGTSLVEAIASIHQFLCSRVAGQKYATLMAVQLRREGALQIVNCGHVPALLLRDGEMMTVSEGDLPVGLIPQTDFHVMEHDFPVGSRVCLFTDGITESEDDEGTQFGNSRLEQYLAAPDPVREIFAAVESFSDNQEAQDDRTLVVLERTG